MIDIDRLRSCLDDAHEAEPWLRSLRVENLPAAHANFTRMATHGVTLDLLSQISEQFATAAPGLADPDMAINNLERFIAAARNPIATSAALVSETQQGSVSDCAANSTQPHANEQFA